MRWKEKEAPKYPKLFQDCLPFTVCTLRLYPTNQQARRMCQTLETCRLLYNNLLDERIRIHSSYIHQKRELVNRKHDDKYLQSVYSQVLQDVALRLDKAYNTFFRGLGSFPRFKRKGRYKSFTYLQAWRTSRGAPMEEVDSESLKAALDFR